MMRISLNSILLKVIFVLSTIVAVTDCCSSRILLLREHTLKIVEHQHNFHNHLHEHAHQLQQEIEQHVVELRNQLEQLQLEVGQQPSPDDAQPLLQWQDLAGSGATAETTERSSTASEEISTSSSTSSSIISTSTAESSSEPSSSSTAATTLANSSKDAVYYGREVHVCSGSYKTDFCLNGGRCFRFPMVNHSFVSCECADGYVGERCESKSLNGLYVPTPPPLDAQPKILMARIVFSFPMLVLLSTIYVVFGALFLLRSEPSQRRKQQQQLRLHKQRFFVSC